MRTPLATSRRLLHLGSPLALALVLACAAAGSPPRAAAPALATPTPAATSAAAGASAGPPAGGPASWARGAVVYELFVRSFADSDGDGIGDFRGLTAKLDYLNDGKPGGSDLGVDAVWLMPVFESPSYHGYDTTDYDHVNHQYGTDADFQAFLDAAHRRGIKVILDLVLNHTSDQHPWFADSAQGWGAPHRQWYVWRGDDPGWTQPWGGSAHTWHPKNGAFYYGIFWSGMPDLDYDYEPVRQEMERVAAEWLQKGVDGFRLDATRHIFADGPGDLQSDRPKTHEFLKELAAFVRGVKPDALLVGENWTTTETIATYYGDPAVPGGDELPMSFDFPLAQALLDGVKSGDSATVASTLAEVQRLYPPGALDAPFLTNHDQVRVATQLAGDPGALRVAAATLLTLPGTPFVYYGEELGLQNGPGSRDEEKRTPMPWDDSAGGGFTAGKPWYAFAPGQQEANVAAESGDGGSLLAWYRTLVALRHGSTALRTGTLELLPSADAATAGGPVLAFLRRAPTETVLVLHNLSDAPATSPTLPYRSRDLRAYGLTAGKVVAQGKSACAVQLPARGSAMFRLTRRR